MFAWEHDFFRSLSYPRRQELARKGRASAPEDRFPWLCKMFLKPVAVTRTDIHIHAVDVLINEQPKNGLRFILVRCH